MSRLNCLACCSTAKHSTAQHIAAWQSTTQHAVHSVAQHSAAQHSTAQHSMLWPKATAITCYAVAAALKQQSVCVLTVCFLVGSARLCCNVTGQGARGVERGRVGSQVCVCAIMSPLCAVLCPCCLLCFAPVTMEGLRHTLPFYASSFVPFPALSSLTCCFLHGSPLVVPCWSRAVSQQLT